MKQEIRYRRGRLNFTEIGKHTITKFAIVIDQTRIFRLNRERQALLLAKSRGLNVPQVIDYYINKEGKEVLIIEKVSGRELSFKQTRFNFEKMREVGREMIKLSSISMKFGWPDHKNFCGQYHRWDLFLKNYIGNYGKRLVEAGILPFPIIEKISHFLKSVELGIEKSSLVHKDIKPGNVLSTSSDKVYIIDWENALFGDSLFDVASYGVNYGHDKLWEGLIAGFGVIVNSDKYKLYELIILIGVIDFYRKQKLNYSEKIQNLMNLIEEVSRN